jgi:nucleotide-binding universal stress UspA family protein
MSPIRSILYPTDFSEAAEAAFSVATMLAREHGARLIVLHVYPTPVCHGEAVARRQGPGYEADLRRLLDRYDAPDPSTRVERLLLEGDAAEEIVRLAEEEADLIVLGTRGRTGLPRLLLGSVAEKVLRRAPCPVITVRATAAGKAAQAAGEKAVAAGS